jgi:hypothetical protein
MVAVRWRTVPANGARGVGARISGVRTDLPEWRAGGAEARHDRLDDGIVGSTRGRPARERNGSVAAEPCRR